MVLFHLLQPLLGFLFRTLIAGGQSGKHFQGPGYNILIDDPAFIHMMIRKQGQGVVDFFGSFLLFEHPFGPRTPEKGAHIHVEMLFFYLFPYPYQDKNNNDIVHKVAGVEFPEYFKIGDHQQGRQRGAPHFGGNLLFPHHLIKGVKEFGFPCIKIFRHIAELFHVQGPHFKHRL